LAFVRLPTGARRQHAFDATLAGVLLVASVVDLFTHGLGGVYPHATWIHLPFVVLTSLPIAVRRRWPLAALIVLAVVQSAWIYGLYPMDQQPPLVPFVQLLVVVYTAAAYSDGRAARAACVVVALGIGTDIPTLIVGKPLGDVAGPDISLLIAFSLGLGFARSRRRADAQEERAARAERDRLEAVECAAAQERARIARELHDVISHDVSLMVLQASVERRVHTGDVSTTQTLENIESTGREALAELRRMLGVLRKSDDDAPLRPQPGLAQLPDLVAQARAAGLPAQLVVDGAPIAVPAGLDIAAYRIVQEALTNAAKHAAGAAVTATVRYRAGALEIEIADDGGTGSSVPLPRGGHGLVGMRERVAMFDGSLEAANVTEGGFRVRARLPLPG
jgi:signal transduction histidine kinase